MHRQYLLPFFPSTALVPVVFLLGHHHFCGRALPLSRFYFGTRPRRNWKGRWNNSERGGWPRVTRRIKIFARGEIIILRIRRDRSMRSAILILLADVEMGREKKGSLIMVNWKMLCVRLKIRVWVFKLKKEMYKCVHEIFNIFEYLNFQKWSSIRYWSSWIIKYWNFWLLFFKFLDSWI